MKDIANLSDTLATEAKGVTVQASTLGALEALLEFLRNPGKDRQGKERPPIPVSGATVGPIHKKDVIKAAIMAQKGSEEYSCILGFDVPVDPEAQAYADKNQVKIFTADIIYHLEGHFTRHLDEIMERKERSAGCGRVPVIVQDLEEPRLQHEGPHHPRGGGRRWYSEGWYSIMYPSSRVLGCRRRAVDRVQS